ncbi:MAG: hypothetical protein P8Y65_08860 [Campylobacterales bacterium]
MTASEFEHANKPGTEVRFNPFLVFVFFLTAPYLLFFLLLMLVTGQFDVVLLAEAVWERDWDAYMKTWVIGTFVLSVGRLRSTLFRPRRRDEPQGTMSAAVRGSGSGIGKQTS